MRRRRNWPPSACPITHCSAATEYRARRPCAASWGAWIPVRSVRRPTTTFAPCCPHSPAGRSRSCPNVAPSVRAHRAAAHADPVRIRRRAIAVDGKGLRGARCPDGSRVFVLSAVRHGVMLASQRDRREDQLDPRVRTSPRSERRRGSRGDSRDRRSPARRDHATYLRERGAHYLLTIKNNQRAQARQLHALPSRGRPSSGRPGEEGRGVRGRAFVVE